MIIKQRKQTAHATSSIMNLQWTHQGLNLRLQDDNWASSCLTWKSTEKCIAYWHAINMWNHRLIYYLKHNKIKCPQMSGLCQQSINIMVQSYIHCPLVSEQLTPVTLCISFWGVINEVFYLNNVMNTHSNKKLEPIYQKLLKYCYFRINRLLSLPEKNNHTTWQHLHNTSCM